MEGILTFVFVTNFLIFPAVVNFNYFVVILCVESVGIKLNLSRLSLNLSQILASQVRSIFSFLHGFLVFVGVKVALRISGLFHSNYAICPAVFNHFVSLGNKQLLALEHLVSIKVLSSLLDLFSPLRRCGEVLIAFLVS